MDYQTIGSLLENPQVVGTAIGLGAVVLAGAGVIAYDTIRGRYQRRQLNRQLELERELQRRDPQEYLEEFKQEVRKKFGPLYGD